MTDDARWRLRFSMAGAVVGSLFFAASLTPSLIPRSDLIQGVLGGVTFAVGYGIGAAFMGIWRGLELPELQGIARRALLWLAASLSVGIGATFLAYAASWQDSIRLRMDMPPTDAAHPLTLLAVAIPVAAALIGVGKLIGLLISTISRALRRVLSPRASSVVGMIVVAVVVAMVASGVLLRGVLRVVDASAQALDSLIPPDTGPPDDAMMTGSAASLIDWEHLGREGRIYIASTPTAETIADVAGGETIRPVRVYAGLNAAEDAAARAALALRELERVGGFERSVLVIAMPTGTGWMDPAAIEPLEFLHRGDVATIGIQYSYLQSWISILVEPEYSVEAGRALFWAVYERWRALPEATRPRLYLYGLSLGAYSSQQSLRLHELIDAPIDGALWVGPPFVSPLWQTLTSERRAGSPAWLPVLSDKNVVRFTNGREDMRDMRWGRMRIVYLQYASDPIVFFETTAGFFRPAWMAPPVGPDVSPELRWYPVVTQLQLAVDMAVSVQVPIGHGHNYHPSHHIASWIAVTQPTGWDAGRLRALYAYFDRWATYRGQ